MNTRTLVIAGVLGAAWCLAAASHASAAPGSRKHATSHQVSDNWSGYVVTARSAFRRVVGSWVQPKASCGGETRRYSAFWVGIGGFKRNAHALEQIGTEADCTNGHSASYAWYELLPAGEVTLNVAAHPGDHMAASVTVSGEDVALHLHDLTTGGSFARTVRMHSPDSSSAEWIAEAPSECTGGGQRCRVLPLADFSSVSFSGATAATRGGPMRPIAGASFHAYEETLESNGACFGGPVCVVSSAYRGERATPTALADAGSSFSITWEAGHVPQPLTLPEAPPGRPELPPTFLPER
jgi:Peptidase A4 family